MRRNKMSVELNKARLTTRLDDERFHTKVVSIYKRDIL